MKFLSLILKPKKITPAYLSEIEEKLFHEGKRKQRHISQFAVLMFLSTVIATSAIIADSTATVIGAMLIAPLMIPILGTTAGLVMGNARRARESITLVIAGVIGVIIVSAALGSLGMHVVDFDTNTQITSRVAPRMLELLIALAAGTAGAYAMSRKEIADSIPGVAISIALVPPLCVVGISLAAGQWQDALGALLLFLTNLVSILFAGWAIFTWAGLASVTADGLNKTQKKTAFGLITLGVILIMVPLAISTVNVGRDSIAQVKIRNMVESSVNHHSENVVIKAVLVSGKSARVVIGGPDAPSEPFLEDLKKRIQAKEQQIESIKLLYTPSVIYQYPQPQN
jgi:uncharacterized hydrophobic protein (TIGR00271 family)